MSKNTLCFLCSSRGEKSKNCYLPIVISRNKSRFYILNKKMKIKKRCECVIKWFNCVIFLFVDFYSIIIVFLYLYNKNIILTFNYWNV